MSGDGPEAVFRLADYVCAFSPAPAGLRARARLAVLDILGCMVGAAITPAGAMIVDAVADRGADGATTTVSLTAGRRSEDSALANATLAHMLEFDDGHRPSDNHLGCVVVPSALAIAEEARATVGDLLDAIIVGYDVMGRVGEATLLPRRRSPFHGTGTTGVFGAAAVAARLLGMSAERTAHAMAIAGTAAAGLRESTNSGPECKPLHAGRAARSGVESAYLARGGYSGPREIIEGRHGFCVAMCDEPRPELVTDALGARFAVAESGFKVHSTCGMLFTMLDGVVAAREEFSPRPAQPDLLRVGVPVLLATEPAFTRRHPETGGQARFSISYAVATAWRHGQVLPSDMLPDRLLDPEIADLEDRVEIAVDPEAEAIYQRTCADPFFFYPAVVEVGHGGVRRRSLHTSPRGYDPSQPLTADEVERKFLGVAAPVLGTAEATQLARLVLGCADSEPAAELVRRTGSGRTNYEPGRTG
jgi:2-methylcitrate dehydratase PrpD